MIYLVAARSILEWFPRFTNLAHVKAVLIDDSAEAGQIHDILSVIPDGEELIFCPSHGSFDRDVQLRELLMSRGHVVEGVTELAATVALDKIEMKRLFRTYRIHTPLWGTNWDERDRLGFPLVKKGVSGTMGSENVLIEFDAEQEFSNDCFFEEFVEGVEFSVNTFRSSEQVFTLPPVWKGPTNIGLVPPFRRLRMCPWPSLSSQQEVEMRRIAVNIVQTMGFTGFAEVEFVADFRGQLMVLEVNPRISGTLRMSAVAAKCMVFDLPYLSPPQHIPSCRFAAETPLLGTTLTHIHDDDVSITSRVTVGGESFAKIGEKLSDLHNNGLEICPEHIAVVAATSVSPNERDL